ncbi:hypothetical protein BS50DRAFT_641049 [Corynespora cassiicola Philippines]|uniref:Uncharacterized protein n=1 Tax=Corynespora cassiicola Philippines TaxID=1448308 RepID=A0A2T2N1N9_CORCC|nr:hypothetical protein BS50DRAFT_641049 [Corynespora cassiicola Philippines]
MSISVGRDGSHKPAGILGKWEPARTVSLLSVAFTAAHVWVMLVLWPASTGIVGSTTSNDTNVDNHYAQAVDRRLYLDLDIFRRERFEEASAMRYP